MALVSSYDAFILDYGGVLVHHQTEADQTRLSEIARIPSDSLNELYWSERPDYDKDLVSGAEYWQRVARDAGTTLSAKGTEELIEFDTCSWMRFDSVMWDWVNQLHLAGKRLALLSNMPRDLGEALKSRTQKFSAFDYITLSYEVRAVKPNPVIYEMCLEGLGTPPERTLFLDDRIDNVQAAELLGIQAIQFTSRDDVLLRLCA